MMFRVCLLNLSMRFSSPRKSPKPLISDVNRNVGQGVDINADAVGIDKDVGGVGTLVKGGRECYVTDFIQGEELKAVHAKMQEAEMVNAVIYEKPTGQLGIRVGVMYALGQVIVLQVSVGTAAHKSGVKDGDILLRINQEDVEARNEKSVRQLTSATYPLSLTLLRGASVEACIRTDGIIADTSCLGMDSGAKAIAFPLDALRDNADKVLGSSDDDGSSRQAAEPPAAPSAETPNAAEDPFASIIAKAEAFNGGTATAEEEGDGDGDGEGGVEGKGESMIGDSEEEEDVEVLGLQEMLAEHEITEAEYEELLYEHELGQMLERGDITQEEHDELLAEASESEQAAPAPAQAPAQAPAASSEESDSDDDC